jgi:peptidyl-prolyl cis-trans isomerase B (cyclophilin B)
VSPTSSKREREYARRRYEKWATKQQERAAQRRRVRRNAIAAGGAVVAVLAAVIAVAVVRGVSSSGSPTAAGANPSASATATSAPTASATSTTSAAAATDPCPKPTVSAPATPKSWKTAPPKTLAKGATWRLALTTTCGTVTISLDGAKAPQAVSNAVFLAQNDFWNGTPCHRLVTSGIYVLQCGDPTGSGTGGPGYSFGPVENAPKNGVYPAGTVAMARTNSPDGNGSQFFIVYKQSQLPTTGGGYTVFGKVLSGLDVVQKIAAGGAQGGSDGAPLRPISIVSATVRQG